MKQTTTNTRSAATTVPGPVVNGAAHEVDPTANLPLVLVYATAGLAGLVGPKKQEPETRFHAFQALFCALGALAAHGLLQILGGVFAQTLQPLFDLAAVGGYVYLVWKVYHGRLIQLPVIGTLARNQAAAAPADLVVNGADRPVGNHIDSKRTVKMNSLVLFFAAMATLVAAGPPLTAQDAAPVAPSNPPHENALLMVRGDLKFPGDLRVDGRLVRGLLPARLTAFPIEPGLHHLSVISGDGKSFWEQEVELRPGRSEIVYVKLIPRPPKEVAQEQHSKSAAEARVSGTTARRVRQEPPPKPNRSVLRIRTDLAVKGVFVDGSQVKAHLSEWAIEDVVVEPGPHVVQAVSADGLDRREVTAQVGAGETQLVLVDLDPVRKERLGRGKEEARAHAAGLARKRERLLALQQQKTSCEAMKGLIGQHQTLRKEQESLTPLIKKAKKRVALHNLGSFFGRLSQPSGKLDKINRTLREFNRARAQKELRLLQDRKSQLGWSIRDRDHKIKVARSACRI